MEFVDKLQATNKRLMSRLSQLLNENRQLKRSKCHMRLFADIRELKIENLRETLRKKDMQIESLKLAGAAALKERDDAKSKLMFK